MIQRAVYRADGSKSIGMGHLYRGFFIQAELKRVLGIETTFIVKDNATATSFLVQRELGHLVLPADISLEAEIERMAAISKELNPCLAFLDVLENDVDEAYTNAFSRDDLLLIAITDDSYYRKIRAGVVINGNPNQNPADYVGQPGDYYVGPRYFIMDPDYARIETTRPIGPPAKILITLGGTDHHNLLFSILASIDDCYKVTIITSQNTGYLEKLKEYLAHRTTLSCNCHVDVPSLAGYWGQHDAAITAGGNTLFERIASRLPGATICQLERQLQIADRFEKLGVNVNIGFGVDLSAAEMSTRINQFLRDYNTQLAQYENAPLVLRGDGLSLLINTINNKLRSKSEKLRGVVET